jgi:hypothetical protein
MSDGLKIKEASGAVFVYGIALQATALHFCNLFQQNGVRATIGLLPGVAGYQVIVHQLAIADVASMLKRFGLRFQMNVDEAGE